jgi:hypothetical protein
MISSPHDTKPFGTPVMIGFADPEFGLHVLAANSTHVGAAAVGRNFVHHTLLANFWCSQL